MSRFDALVIGAATVGAAAALALARSGRTVAVLDRREPGSRADSEPISEPMDPRVVAVSPGSRSLLDALGIWRHVRRARVAPYTQMQVMAGAGAVEFDAAEHGLEALGWIVELGELDHAASAALGETASVTLRIPAEVESIATGDDGETAARVRLADTQTLHAGLLFGADGARSRVRSAAGIPTTVHHYNQCALVAHLETERLNPGIAWQRFGEAGPLALLPLPDGRSSLVWSVHADRARRLLAASDDEFCAALDEAARGSPFGPTEALATRHALPLVRRQSKTLAVGRVALVGDAARSVHPLAGQGLNLGLGDVAALQEALATVAPGADPGPALQRYARRRGSDAILIAGGIHALNEIHRLGEPARLALGAGFSLLRYLPAARNAFVRRAALFHPAGTA